MTTLTCYVTISSGFKISKGTLWDQWQISHSTEILTRDETRSNDNFHTVLISTVSYSDISHMKRDEIIDKWVELLHYMKNLLKIHIRPIKRSTESSHTAGKGTIRQISHVTCRWRNIWTTLQRYIKRSTDNSYILCAELNLQLSHVT